MGKNGKKKIHIALPKLFNRRLALEAAIGVAAGIAVFALCGKEYAFYALTAVCMLAVGAFFFYKRALLICVCAVLALSSILIQCPDTIAVKNGYVNGTVSELPEEDTSGETVILKDVTVDGHAIRGKLKVTISSYRGIEFGDRIAVKCYFSAAEGSYQYYLYSQGIASQATTKGSNVHILSSSDGGAYGWLLRLRTAIADRIAELIPEHPALAQGMLLGSAASSDDVTDDSVEQFRTLGLAHLLAVSGLHLGIIAGIVLALLKPVKKWWIRFGVLAVFLVFYALLTAMTPSVVRASIMMLITVPAVPLKRRYDGPSSLGTAFTLILLVRPFSLWRAGFQLSFLAVGGIILLGPIFTKAFSFMPEKIASLLSTDFAVVIATLPATAYFFGTVPLSAIPANILILPLVPFFIVPALIALAVSFIYLPAGAFLSWGARGVLALIVKIASLGGEMSVTVAAPSVAAYLAFLVTLVLVSPLCLLKKLPKAAVVLVSAAITCALWLL